MTANQTPGKYHPNRKQSEKTIRIRKFLLTLCYLVLLICTFTLPRYNLWLKRIYHYYTEFTEQIHKLNIETRLAERQGINHWLPAFLKDHLGDRMDVVFLLPPQAYLNEFHPVNIWAEPRGFYYFAGKIPTVEVDDPGVINATHTVLFNTDKQPVLVEISSELEFQQIISLFR